LNRIAKEPKNYWYNHNIGRRAFKSQQEVLKKIQNEELEEKKAFLLLANQKKKLNLNQEVEVARKSIH